MNNTGKDINKMSLSEKNKKIILISGILFLAAAITTLIVFIFKNMAETKKQAMKNVSDISFSPEATLEAVKAPVKNSVSSGSNQASPVPAPAPQTELGTPAPTNLGAKATKIFYAFHGSVFSEDEKTAINTLLSVPKENIKALSEFYFNVYKKSLQQDFVKYLSASEYELVKNHF